MKRQHIITIVTVLGILLGFLSPSYGDDAGNRKSMVETFTASQKTFMECTRLGKLIVSYKKGEIDLSEEEIGAISGRLYSLIDSGFQELNKPENEYSLRFVENNVIPLFPESMDRNIRDVIAVSKAPGTVEEKVVDIKGILDIVCISFLIPAIVLFVVGIVLSPLLIPVIIMLPLALIFYVMYLICMLIF